LIGAPPIVRPFAQLKDRFMPTRSQVRTWIAVIGLLSPSMAPSVAAGQDRTERDIVELIARDGPRARAIRAEAEVTRREQLARLAYPNPNVTWSREGAGFTEFFQAEQALPIFGVRASLARAGVAATAAAEADRDVRLWALRSEASAAVARLAGEQERVAASHALVREMERLIEILRTREQEGEGSRFDRLRAEQELRDARQQATGAAAAAAEARAALSGMLPAGVVLAGITPDTEPRQQEPVPSAGVEALVARATGARAELRALQQAGQRATSEAEAARRARLAAPTVFGGLKRADDDAGRERGGVFGVTVGIPLFDAGGREAARWSAEGARVAAEREAIERRIHGEIAGAVEVLALRHAALAEEQPEAASELARIAEVAYREGEVGILELLDAVRTASRARNRAIDIRQDARLARIALERVVGEPLWP
jgi:cobalt-zinc-cadmium efflux system outer membrane protein